MRCRLKREEERESVCGEDGRWVVDDCVFRVVEAGFAGASSRRKMQMQIADTVGKGCAVVTAVSVWRWNGRRFKVSVGDRGVGRRGRTGPSEKEAGHRATGPTGTTGLGQVLGTHPSAGLVGGYPQGR